jgi:hypothetical protein
MQTWTILRRLILRLVLFVTIAVVFNSLSWPVNVFALSPAFGREEIGSPWAATSTFPFFTFGEFSLVGIGLSVFLLQHPSFFAILEIENEFGVVLAVLLGIIIVISCIWLVAGIRQCRLIGSWNNRYGDYITEKQEMHRKIASQYGEDSRSSSDQ